MPEKVLMTEEDIRRTLARIAHESSSAASRWTICAHRDVHPRRTAGEAAGTEHPKLQSGRRARRALDIFPYRDDIHSMISILK